MTHILHLKGKRVLSSITGLGHLSNQNIYIYINCTQSTVLRKFVQYIVDFCLRHGYFPRSLKLTVPIYENVAKTLPSSYRPISIVSIYYY